MKAVFQLLLSPLVETWKIAVYLHSIFGKAFILLGSVGGLLVTLGGLLWGFVELEGGLAGITASINNSASMLRAMPIAPTMHMVNRVFPLNELLVMEGVLMAVFIACTLVRWIKSFIPTIN